MIAIGGVNKMGWQVISFVNIDLWKQKKKITKDLWNKINKILEHTDALNIEGGDAGIYFELNCNKQVDYSPVDEIKELLLKAGLKFEICASEYVESEGNGYYFDTEEEK